jgi:hypothetical protein
MIAAMINNSGVRTWILLTALFVAPRAAADGPCPGVPQAVSPFVAPGDAPIDVNQPTTRTRQTRAAPSDTPRNVLSTDEWRQVDSAVDRGLAFLASHQDADGSFPSLRYAQPAVTSLCVLSFMAHGHTPGSGRYGAQLERAVQFIMDCQKPSGLIALEATDDKEISRDISRDIGVASTYDHAISALTLSELYGMHRTSNSSRMKNAIAQALEATYKIQHWPKDIPEDEGGWRYINKFDQSDSDLSVTGWYLMSLRSARNAGFDVPQQTIAEAVAYIRRTFDDDNGMFHYRINRGDDRSRGMVGAGILALGHAGFHNSVEAKRAAENLLQYSFEVYNDGQPFPSRDRYHYSLFMCCQGMYQMGNPYWEKFFPRTVRAVLAHQNADGSWDAERFQRDRRFGNSYTTAMVILAVGAPNQLLPIFQR